MDGVDTETAKYAMSRAYHCYKTNTHAEIKDIELLLSFCMGVAKEDYLKTLEGNPLQLHTIRNIFFNATFVLECNGITMEAERKCINSHRSTIK
jgi:hypothetical protein